MNHMKAIAVIFTFFVSILLFVGINNKPQQAKKHNDDKQNTPNPVEPLKPTPPQIHYPDGNSVKWINYPSQKSYNEREDMGEFLFDIETHLPEKYGNQYTFENDQNTWGHETTHGINAHLNMLYGNIKENYCFYVGNNKAAVIKQPDIKITQVANVIPEIHRKSRYKTYMVDQAGSWDDYPLYIFDEWVAYTNGGKVGVELLGKKLLRGSGEKTDAVHACLEFNVYAMYVCMAVKKYDPNYDNKQFLEFVAWNCKNSMEIYYTGSQYNYFNWDDDKYLKELQMGESAKELREFVMSTFGEAWAKEVFNFTK